MSSTARRIRHRRHLSAALAAVRSSLALRETHKRMEGRLDWLILPELSVHPDDVQTHLIPFARAHKTIILEGLNYENLVHGKPLVNSAIWVLPIQDPVRGVQIITRRQVKQNLAPNEKKCESSGLLRSFRPCQWLIGCDWSADQADDLLWLTAGICFDATDLQLGADLKNRSDVFAIPAMNKDGNTFDNMAIAFATICIRWLSWRTMVTSAEATRMHLSSNRGSVGYSTRTVSLRLRSCSSKWTTSQHLRTVVRAAAPLNRHRQVSSEIGSGLVTSSKSWWSSPAREA